MTTVRPSHRWMHLETHAGCTLKPTLMELNPSSSLHRSGRQRLRQAPAEPMHNTVAAPAGQLHAALQVPRPHGSVHAACGSAQLANQSGLILDL